FPGGWARIGNLFYILLSRFLGDNYARAQQRTRADSDSMNQVPEDALKLIFHLTIIKPAQVYPERASFNNPGGFLLSHAVARAVPSAPRGLTSVFGMGTGVTLSTQPPENLFDFGLRIADFKSEIGI